MPECPECGGDGDIGQGYGEQSAVTCPDCGNEWVAESPGGSYLG